MFLYYFSHISRPLQDVIARLDGSERWLPGDFADACDVAAAMAPALGPDGALPWRHGHVDVAVAPLGGVVGAGVRSIRAKGGAGLPFGRLDADLEVTELGTGSSQLTLRGSYETPADLPLDAELGRLHRLTEAVTKSFVERVAARLETGNEQEILGPKAPGR